MTETEARTILNKYLKRHDKDYKKIERVISRREENFGRYCFACYYVGQQMPSIYVVFEKNRQVFLAPTQIRPSRPLSRRYAPAFLGAAGSGQ